mmetsp:Transcript_96006/g.280611  ORF Transcript_96006/g.280611 Transcript_96006/m.280611 type:complete len:227 (+) Transcript_96006:1483-2163(+)
MGWPCGVQGFQEAWGARHNHAAREHQRHAGPHAGADGAEHGKVEAELLRQDDEDHVAGAVPVQILLAARQRPRQEGKGGVGEDLRGHAGELVPQGHLQHSERLWALLAVEVKLDAAPRDARDAKGAGHHEQGAEALVRQRGLEHRRVQSQHAAARGLLQALRYGGPDGGLLLLPRLPALGQLEPRLRGESKENEKHAHNDFRKVGPGQPNPREADGGNHGEGEDAS